MINNEQINNNQEQKKGDIDTINQLKDLQGEMKLEIAFSNFDEEKTKAFDKVLKENLEKYIPKNLLS